MQLKILLVLYIVHHEYSTVLWWSFKHFIDYKIWSWNWKKNWRNTLATHAHQLGDGFFFFRHFLITHCHRCLLKAPGGQILIILNCWWLPNFFVTVSSILNFPVQHLIALYISSALLNLILPFYLKGFKMYEIYASFIYTVHFSYTLFYKTLSALN